MIRLLSVYFSPFTFLPLHWSLGVPEALVSDGDPYYDQECGTLSAVPLPFVCTGNGTSCSGVFFFYFFRWPFRYPKHYPMFGTSIRP